MSVLNYGQAGLAFSKRNNTLPPHYHDCTQQQPSLDCLFGLSSQGFPVALEMTTTDLELRAAWTCQEIEGHCARVQSWQNRLNALYEKNSLGAYDPSDTLAITFELTLGGKVLAPIGLILNILLFVTFCSPRLKGRVFWYLRAVALAQICQAVEKISSDFEFSIISYITSTNSRKSFVFIIVYGLTNLFPFFKQFAIAMGLFVSLEQFVSVFSKIELTERLHKRRFFAAMICSIAIGALTLFSIWTILYYDEKKGKWVSDEKTQWNKIRTWISNNISAYFIVSFDIGAILLALIFTISINVHLARRSRKIHGMLSTASVRDEHKRMLSYARLQTIDTVSLILDLCTTLFGKLHTTISESLRYCVSRDCLFPNVIRGYLIAFQFSLQASYLFEILGGFCHAEQFFLYLIFSKKFRDAFRTVWGDIYKKMKSVKCNRN